MSDNGDCIMSPPPPFEEATRQKQPNVSSCSSEGSTVHNSNSQLENNYITVDCPPSAFSVQEDQRKLKYLIKWMTVIEVVKVGLVGLILCIGFMSMAFFGGFAEVSGVPLYNIWLASHALSFLFLSIVRNYLLTPLVDAYNIIICKMDGQRYHPPTRMSKKVLFWWYYLPYPLALAGISIFLSYMDLQEVEEGSDEDRRQIGIGFFAGTLLLLVSVYVVWPVGSAEDELKVKKRERTHGKDNSGKRVDFEMHNLSRTEDGQKRERVEEIIKVRKEMLHNNASYSKLLQENHKILIQLLNENERLRKENLQVNIKNLWFPPESTNIEKVQQGN